MGHYLPSRLPHQACLFRASEHLFSQNEEPGGQGAKDPGGIARGLRGPRNLSVKRTAGKGKGQLG